MGPSLNSYVMVKNSEIHPLWMMTWDRLDVAWKFQADEGVEFFDYKTSGFKKKRIQRVHKYLQGACPLRKSASELRQSPHTHCDRVV